MSIVSSHRFQTGVSAFFEMATSDARALLPSHLEPIEVRHQRSVLSVNVFLFDDSVVGPYTEVMFAVIVPPLVAAWGQHAKAGLYPFLAATSSEEARRIKSERFHFPYHDDNIDDDNYFSCMYDERDYNYCFIPSSTSPGKRDRKPWRRRAAWPEGWRQRPQQRQMQRWRREQQ